MAAGEGEMPQLGSVLMLYDISFNVPPMSLGTAIVLTLDFIKILLICS